MGFNLDVLVVGSCRLIGLIMVSWQILLLLTLEVEYFLWCLGL